MKRKHKIYSKPKRPFDKKRIEEEFGLKNKKEIWKAEAKIKLFREKAKKLISSDEKSQSIFFEKLKKIGLNVNSISDVLALDKKDYLNRRLQTVLFKNSLAPTIKSARQMIVHKKVLIDNKIMNSPSYIIPKKFEDKMTIKEIKIKEPKR
jgi:small subunit ribosomal protein S4